jgi:hypothetical protein
VLLTAVKVNGRPFGELAVTGTMSVLPAGIFALGIGSIAGVASTASHDCKRSIRVGMKIRRAMKTGWSKY